MIKPLLITMGDPSGTGPELAVKAWLKLRNTASAFAIIGDADPFNRALKSMGAGPSVKVINSPSEATACFPIALPIIQSVKLSEPAVQGIPNKNNAMAIIDAIKHAIEHVANGRAKAIVTLPIAKSVLYDAGFPFAGHTEFIANEIQNMPFNHARGPVMMLAIPGLKVALATIHEPLSKVPTLLSIERIVDVVRVVGSSLKNDFGVPNPRIGLLGLNPHAGENGAIGDEEARIINPAAQLLREGGIDCSDALPADSAFAPHLREKFDCFIAMYHDQGLIPIKAIDFWGGVNITLGLPIIRTSPDHGTGFDIAGKNIANEESLLAAIKTASYLSENRAKNNGL
jgi:4-hydroxythreonine-4-phosphate dehydrogenase